MEETINLISNVGVPMAICIVILVLSLRYIPQWLDYRLNRAKEKDYMIDSFKSVIENNSQVIKNNSEVIKLNSTTIKNYTDNSHKLEQNIEELTKVI